MQLKNIVTYRLGALDPFFLSNLTKIKVAQLEQDLNDFTRHLLVS